MRRFFSSAALFLIFANRPLYAEAPIKRLIVHDCSRASFEFAKLDNKDRSQLLPFLRLVLKLDLVPDDPITLPNPQGTLIGHTLDRGREMVAPSMLYGLVASPESSAKRCAVNLISEMGEDGAQAVPELAALAEDVSAPNVVRDEAEYVAKRIINSVSHRSSTHEVRPMIIGLLDLFLDTHSSLAYRFLAELGEPVIEPIVERLMGAQDQDRKTLIELLFGSSLTNWIWQPAELEDLINQAPDVRERLASAIALTSTLTKEQWALLLNLAHDDVEKVREGFFKSLAKIKPERLSTLFDDQPTVALLINCLSSATVRESEQAAKILATTPFAAEEIENSLITLIQAKSTQRTPEHILVFAKREVKYAASVKVLTDFSYSNDTELRAAAILALSSARNFKKEVLSTLLKLLKRNMADKDLHRKHETINVVGFALARLNLTLKEAVPFHPYLIENLAFASEKQSSFNRGLHTPGCEELNGTECGLIYIALSGDDLLKRIQKKAKPALTGRIELLMKRLEQIQKSQQQVH